MAILELKDVDGDGEADIVAVVEVRGAIGQDDVDEAAQLLEPNSSALLILFEHAWAAEVTQAMRDAAGEVIYMERIPAAVVEQALAALGLNPSGPPEGATNHDASTRRARADGGHHGGGRRHGGRGQPPPASRSTRTRRPSSRPRRPRRPRRRWSTRLRRPPPPAGIDMAQLKQLGDLHAAGVLTDEEFAAAKAKLLG